MTIIEKHKTSIEDFELHELVNELERRGYDFLDGASDDDLIYEYDDRGLYEDSDEYRLQEQIDELSSELDELRDIEDKILELFYELSTKKFSPEFEIPLRKFFYDTINKML